MSGPVLTRTHAILWRIWWSIVNGEDQLVSHRPAVVASTTSSKQYQTEVTSQTRISRNRWWTKCLAVASNTGRKTLSESQTNGEQMLLPFVIPLRDLKGCQIQKHNINRWHNATLSRNYSQNLNRIRIFIVVMLILLTSWRVYINFVSHTKPYLGFLLVNKQLCLTFVLVPLHGTEQLT